VVGLVERGSGKCWLEIVHSRDASTLEGIILRHVLPGSVIVTDAWLGYVNVATLNNGVYVHEVVVHAQHFADPIRNQYADNRRHVDASKEETSQSKWYKPGLVTKLFV
jgi:hypothetical protein